MVQVPKSLSVLDDGRVHFEHSRELDQISRHLIIETVLEHVVVVHKHVDKDKVLVFH